MRYRGEDMMREWSQYSQLFHGAVALVREGFSRA